MEHKAVSNLCMGLYNVHSALLRQIEGVLTFWSVLALSQASSCCPSEATRKKFANLVLGSFKSERTGAIVYGIVSLDLLAQIDPCVPLRGCGRGPPRDRWRTTRHPGQPYGPREAQRIGVAAETGDGPDRARRLTRRSRRRLPP